MNFNDIQQRDQAAVMHTYARFPVAIQRGKNARCVDFDGKEYIDFSSGIGVNSLGFANEGWAKAVYEQLTTLQHISNLYYTLPCIQAAELIEQKSGMRKVFFANSGAEANEGAIKTARKYSLQKYGPGRSTIVSLQNSFHGRTVTTLSATGQEVFHKDFFPFTEGFRFAVANVLEATAAQLTQDVCAVLVELVQGEGGVLPLERDYVQGLARLCREKDILLIVDEVQTGAGRTGSFLCFQQFGIQPDLITMAKGIGGGLPLGAVLFGERTADVLQPGDHATTFGGNPAVCAGAKYVLETMDEAFLAQVREKGDYFRQKLLTMPHVKGVAGMGLMLGIELDGVTSREVVEKGIEQGVLTLTAKAKLRLLPPLTITKEEIDQGLERLQRALAQL